jgi:hypothetical protein
MEAFRLDLIDLPLITNPADEVDSLIDHYNVGLASLLDKHAPCMYVCILTFIYLIFSYTNIRSNDG